MPHKDPEKQKAAQRKWREKNLEQCREKERTRARKYREENHEKELAAQRKWREKNPEYAKKWREKNREQHRACAKKWSEENRDKRRAIDKRWRDKNPGKVNAKTASRRRGIKERTPPWADEVAIARKYREAKEMEAIFGVKFHVDHIIPLHGKNVSGLHVAENLQVLEAETHRKKGIKYG